MNKQENVILLRIDNELKNKFKLKCDKEYQTLSARIKYLINKDIENKIKIEEN